jgi:hypothetical protein
MSKVKQLRTYIFQETAVAAIINATLNFGLAWSAYHDLKTVPVLGLGGAAIDLACIPLYIGFLATIISTPLTRGRARRGTIYPVGDARAPRCLAWFPQNLYGRALVACAVSGCLFGFIILATMIIVQRPSLPSVTVILLKVVLTLLITSLVVPQVIALAVSDIFPSTRRIDPT